MSNPVQSFYKEHFDKIQLVAFKQASSPKHKDFFFRIYKINKWKSDLQEQKWLENYIRENYESLRRSLAQIGSKHVITERSEENSLRKRNSFFDFNEDITEDSEIVDALENPYIEEKQTLFKRPEPNVNPKTSRGRSDLISNGKIIYTDGDDSFESRLQELPSSARNSRRFIDLALENYDYADYYKPHATRSTLYKKEQAKKFYGPRGTWMFDLMYFKDYNNKQHRKSAVYLIGININTRYAVCKRVKGKSVKDLIPAFKEILSEVKDLKFLIFDGEKGIVSKQFEDFCKSKNINVRITYPGIHTQTGPIDRLCRTVRDDYMKYFMANHNEIDKITKTTNPWLQGTKRKQDILTQVIQTRKMFNGEDKHKLAPIPSLYAEYYDNEKSEIVSYLLTDEEANQRLKPIPYDIGVVLSGISGFDLMQIERQGFKNEYYEELKERFNLWGVYDELERVVAVYNRRPHHGLIKLLKYAQATFDQPLPLDKPINQVTPEMVNSNPQLEQVIVEYCKYYNSQIAQPSYEFKIGEKVKVYDCFTSNRGSLLNRHEFLIGDWEIHSKDNEIYGVINKNNGQILHVSKYMLHCK